MRKALGLISQTVGGNSNIYQHVIELLGALGTTISTRPCAAKSIKSIERGRDVPEQVNMLCLTTEGLSLTLLDGEKNSPFTEPSIVENGTGASGRPKGMPKLHHAVKEMCKCANVICVLCF